MTHLPGSSKVNQPYPTVCCYCGVGCGIILHKDKNENLSLQGDKDHPVNQGMLCSKGLHLHHTVNDKSDRLLYPQMRYNRNMPLERVTWDEAFTRTAAVFKTLMERYGPDSVAIYASGQCLTEEYYVLNKLMKGFIGSNNIDTNSRLCMSSAVAAYKLALGEDSVPGCYEDIELADCLLITGANPAWCHPIIWRRVEAHKARYPETRIIVVDPRITDTSALADVHLQINPGTDITLHHALGRYLIENHKIDSDFISKHTEGFETYRERVFQTTLEESAKICGIPYHSLCQAAQYIGNAKGYMSMWTMGLNQSAKGVDKNLSLINLSLITGQIGKPGSGPFSLTGQPNAMGGREVGGLANLLPAHRDLKNPVHRQEVQKFWGGTIIGEKSGLTATEMFEALAEEKLKAIWIVCTNPLTSLPNVRMAELGLKKAKFVVVQEISNKAETLTYADVILPAAGWSEKEGTMTNSERRISYLTKVLEPPGEALADAEIVCRFAQKMGFPGFDFGNASQIFAEHVALSKGTHMDISGLDYEILKNLKSVQWPYPKSLKKQKPILSAKGKTMVQKPFLLGKPRLFENKLFYTPSQKAIIHSVSDENRSEKPDHNYPFILTTGRIRDQWHTRSKTGKVSKLNLHYQQAFLEIHPIQALELGIEEDSLTVVRSRRGEVRVRARLSPGIKPGLVFLPMHWGKILGNDLNRTNNLTSELLDPISKEPDFKFCAVHVSKYQKPIQKIVVVGAGASSFGFLKSYRERNQTDSITIFSKEKDPFYNRVLLPDYISGDKNWENLLKMTESEEQDYNMKLLRGISIEKIDRENKWVEDSRGIKTEYDVLILGTGSRPSRPRNVPNLPGIFTIRTRTDADNLKKHIPTKAHVVIIGGGLLGLEMAASLREIGVKISIVHRVSRFLNRQLDALGSQILHEEMIDQGCDIYYNDEVQLFYGRNKITGVGLKSGNRIDCDAAVLAIGTTPNLELARDIGLDCKQGVLVNERLQTSDPHIFAMGEIAEFEGKLYGITAAAEQQAEVLANFLLGDISSYYRGSVMMNILKIQGFDLCSMGIISSPEEKNYEEIIFIDLAKRYYKKCIIYQDKLVGTILIGDKSEFLEFKNLIEGKTELSEKRIQLLRSGARNEPMVGRLVCSCNTVGEGNIQKKIGEGFKELQQICLETGAGTGCGSCRPEVNRILEEYSQKMAFVNV